MSLGVILQVWEADIDGEGVVPEKAHVGHMTLFCFSY